MGGGISSQLNTFHRNADPVVLLTSPKTQLSGTAEEAGSLEEADGVDAR